MYKILFNRSAGRAWLTDGLSIIELTEILTFNLSIAYNGAPRQISFDWRLGHIKPAQFEEIDYIPEAGEPYRSDS